MGSYLDKPETTKKSAFDENEVLEIGASSMQGWRINQEDAHNAIPQLSENASFFAVYDGHGGSEVAEYCSMKLPDFLKQLDSFKNGNYEEALKEAFMGFDKTLLNDSVIDELKCLAKKNPDYEDSDMGDLEEEETAEEIINLHQEAKMPLSEVLEKYKGNVTRIQTVQRVISFQSKTETEAGPSSSSGQCGSSDGGSSSKSVTTSDSSTTQQPASDNEVSSSSGKTNSDTDNNKDEPSSSNSASQANNQQPDSTLVSIPSSSKNDENNSNEPKTTKNNDIVNQDSECSSNGTISEREKNSVEDKKPSPDDAISSTKENGEIGSCSSSTSIASAPELSTNVPVKKPKTSTVEPIGTNDETESDDSDEEHDETYKESPKKKVKDADASTDDDDDDDDEMNSDEEEEMYDDDEEEELSNEEISGEEDEEDGLDDAFMSTMETGPGKASGCTAVVALLVNRDLFVANAGDSRCIVSRSGRVVEMSFDHKPEDQIEFQRIRKAGGRVTLDGRVNGGLNLSRAIGDHGYKMNKELPAEEQMITAMPDLRKITLTEEDDFMILACDGIWNYMSNEEVIGFVKHRIDAGRLSLTEICEELFHNCLAPDTNGDGTGCDNMTAIIVKFKPALYKLPATKDNSNSEAECIAHKRTHEDDDIPNVQPSDKKQKLDDDLTPSTVDTSS